MCVVTVLEVSVGPGCDACESARDIVDRLRAVALPGLETRIIDLSDPDAHRPNAVFAIPTYMLDGNIVSLGNPALDWLLERVTEVLG